jgi:hypothetical protein
MINQTVMKSRIIGILAAFMFLFIQVSAQDGNTKKNSPVGTWKYEAAYAPEEYNSGSIIVGFADKKYSVSVSFKGSTYKLQAEQVKYENDLLTCTIYVEGEYVKISVKAENNNRMTGTATYSQGQVPLTLTRITSAK